MTQGALSLPGGAGTGKPAPATTSPAAATASAGVLAGATAGLASGSTSIGSISVATSGAAATCSPVSSSGNSGANAGVVAGSGSGAAGSSTITVGAAANSSVRSAASLNDVEPADDPRRPSAVTWLPQAPADGGDGGTSTNRAAPALPGYIDPERYDAEVEAGRIAVQNQIQKALAPQECPNQRKCSATGYRSKRWGSYRCFLRAATAKLVSSHTAGDALCG